MSLKVQAHQIVKKVSGVFKGSPATSEALIPWYDRVPLTLYDTVQLPPLPFVPLFPLPGRVLESLLSMEIPHLEQQLKEIDRYLDLIDASYEDPEDDLPISWDDIRFEEPEESGPELLAKQLRADLKLSH